MFSTSKKLSWREVKQQANKLEQTTLLALLGDLYELSEDNRAFVLARLGIGEDPLAPYKAVIDRWVCPNVQRNQDISVRRAKNALSQYKKAVGDAQGIAELALYYCEACADFLSFCGVEDEAYFVAIVNVVEQALNALIELDEKGQQALLERLYILWSQSTDWGWGVSEDIISLMDEHGIDLE